VTAPSLQGSAALTPIEHQLPNGLRIRLLPDRTAKVLAYQTFFRVGSRNEQIGRTGIAHLFEHMMFNGATRYGPKEFDRQLEAHGGSSNAYTSYDLTVYHEEVPSEALDLVIDLESDRMAGLRLSAEALQSEREVVKEERRMRVEDSVFGRLDEELGALVYQANRYHWPVIGWMGDLERLSVEDCEQFFRRYYAPDNATLYLAGDFDPDETLGKLTRAYGDLPPGLASPLEPSEEPEQRGQRRTHLRIPAQTPALLLGFRGLSARDPRAAALDLLSTLLTTGDGSILVRKLVHGRGLCTEVSSDHAWRIEPGIFLIAAELPPGVSPKRVERAILDELDALASRQIAAPALARCKAQLRVGLLREAQTASGRAHALGNAEHLLGSITEAQAQLERLEAVTRRQLREAAAAVFKVERSSLVWVDP
jgi:zinc protease